MGKTGAQDRKNILEDIVRYENPSDLPRLRQTLAAYGRDNTEELIRVTAEDVISILERFLRGELTAKEVELWGEAIDMREDIEFGNQNNDDVISVVIELAGPIEPLSERYAISLIEDLQKIQQ